jgi:hypothetical protein
MKQYFTGKIRSTSLAATTTKPGNIRMLAPLFGTVIFLCLYVVATLFYPGGSQVDKHAKGFSWAQNYWCNLMNEKAINGEHNTARPIALTGMFVLSLALISFWYIFPDKTGLSKGSRLTIQVSGALSMVIGMFIITDLHDIIINVAGIFGLIALTGTLAALHKLRWRKLFWLGIFDLVLVVLNNILYHGNGLMLYLPVVQKITFLFFLLWICLMNIQVFRKVQSKFKPQQV